MGRKGRREEGRGRKERRNEFEFWIVFTLQRAGHLSVSRARTEVQCLGDRASAKSTTTPPRLSLKTVPSFLIFLLSFPLLLLPPYPPFLSILCADACPRVPLVADFFFEKLLRGSSRRYWCVTGKWNIFLSFSFLLSFIINFSRNSGIVEGYRRIEERKEYCDTRFASIPFLFIFCLQTIEFEYYPRVKY